MDPLTIVALILAGLGIAGASIPLFKKIYTKVKTDGVNVKTATEVWAEDGDALKDFVGEVTSLISQGKAMSRAVDDQSKAVDRIANDKAIRDALFETAGKYGPDTIEALAAALTPVPKNFESIAGIDVDKMTKLKNAQREGLSDKESFNKVLGDSGKMLKAIVGIAGEVLPMLAKVKK